MGKARREEQVVRNVDASMRIEGFQLSEETKHACAEIAAGKRSAKLLVQARLSKYAAK